MVEVFEIYVVFLVPLADMYNHIISKFLRFLIIP